MPNSTNAPTVVIRQGGWSRLLAVVGWAGLLICVGLLFGQYVAWHQYFDTTGGIQERFHSGNEGASDKVAILTITGVIVDGQGSVKQQIERIRKDPSVKAVVIRVNSPGGTISGSDYIYHHLRELREQKQLPMVVSMGGIAASGGYYVSMAVGDEPGTIYAEPTSTTGSIGVIVPHYDISRLMEKMEIEDDSIVSHPRKQMLSMTVPMTGEQREIMQSYVDDAFARFKSIVHEGRPKFRNDPAALEELATGQIYTATSAKEFGLVDEIGFIEDAIDRAAVLAGLDADAYRVVRYQSLGSLFDLGLIRSEQGRSAELAMLLELTTPRAYYLVSSLPPLATSAARRD